MASWTDSLPWVIKNVVSNTSDDRMVINYISLSLHSVSWGSNASRSDTPERFCCFLGHSCDGTLKTSIFPKFQAYLRSKNERLRRPRPSVRPWTLYQRQNLLSEFNRIRYKSSLSTLLVHGRVSWDTALYLTLWRRNYFFNFSTPCIQNVNNTGTKQVSIMKQTAFWREKKRRI